MTPDRVWQGQISIRTTTTYKKKDVDCNNLAPHGDLYLQSKKWIDHLPDSAEGKARCSLYEWVGIDIQKDVIYYPTCNVIFCVLCYRLFHSNFDIVNMEDSISTRFKRLKPRKSTNFFTLAWYKILRNACTTVLFTIGRILP